MFVRSGTVRSLLSLGASRGNSDRTQFSANIIDESQIYKLMYDELGQSSLCSRKSTLNISSLDLFDFNRVNNSEMGFKMRLWMSSFISLGDIFSSSHSRKAPEN